MFSLCVSNNFIHIYLVQNKGLDYRYTDNINFWLASLQKLGLPKVHVHTQVSLVYEYTDIVQYVYEGRARACVL